MPVLLRILVLLQIALAGCSENSSSRATLPSKAYHYVQVDTAALAANRWVYVPVYSHLYGEDGTSTVGMTTTLSIRNTSFTDSFYISHVTYYGSQGELLKQYLDKILVVRPMHSVEFVVERMESKGGAGANFVVQWHAAAPPANPPLIQSVTSIISTGFSFVNNGVDIR